MARARTNLGDLATSVLDAVEREQLGKTAASTYTSSSEVGEGLRKLAADLKCHRPASITNEDLAEFRKRYGV